jgi:hypothetical protein
MASVSDTQPLTLALNLGSTDLSSTRVTDRLQQPGMGLPATTYLVGGGGNYKLENYTSGYLTTTLTATGQFTLAISAVTAQVAANPTVVPGWQTSISTLTVVSRDRINRPVPDGTVIGFSATEGVFPNGSSTYTTAVVGGQAITTLTLTSADDLAEIIASVENVTASTSVDVIHPAIEVLVTTNQGTIYEGDVVTYTYRLTNTGDITLTGVTVVDDNVTVCEDIVLAAMETYHRIRSVELFETTITTATVTAQDPLGYEWVRRDSMTVVVRPPEFDIYLPIVTKNR